ncbi:hypothetical protein HPP92_007479 [Vanilla planifolia]|uniref:EF-hand domain-containing protein n=1 Tax=Vanilla planifolia TaxID=51239 RepID=A0A835RDZ5_VANPL|nr:hypothetical protein HPP92_007479 [Vanilla planifolia]
MSASLTGAAISDFVHDKEAFMASVSGRFAILDADADGLISFADMARELLTLRMLDTCFDVDGVDLSHPDLVELHRDIFSRLDRDGSRTAVDLEEFGDEMSEMLMAVACSLGLPKTKWTWPFAKL